MENAKKTPVQREYLTAIAIKSGIITLIEPDGDLGYYRQRHINQIDPKKRLVLIKIGALDAKWADYKELPRNYSISFEDPEIQGRALASFTDRYADAVIAYAKSKVRQAKKTAGASAKRKKKKKSK